MRHSPETNLSDAGVPGIAEFWSCGAQTLAETLQVVGDRQVGNEFHVLVADLAGEAHTQRAAVAHGKLVAIHPIGQKSLRVQCVGHINAVPGVWFYREIDDIFGLREDSHKIQKVGQRHAHPFGDIRPSLFALDHSDLGARRVAFKLIERKRGGPGDHAVDRKPPLSEPSSLKALELVSRRLDLVGEGRLRNLATREFTSQRVPGQQALRSVGERFAEAVDAAVIGRDEAKVLRKARGHAQACDARCGRESGGDQLATREIAHVRSLGVPARPVIIARVRLQNPARKIIATWTRRKSKRARETKKCSVRADCCPPSELTVNGNAETKAGDMAKPVQTTKGKRTKITKR